MLYLYWTSVSMVNSPEFWTQFTCRWCRPCKKSSRHPPGPRIPGQSGLLRLDAISRAGYNVPSRDRSEAARVPGISNVFFFGGTFSESLNFYHEYVSNIHWWYDEYILIHTRMYSSFQLTGFHTALDYLEGTCFFWSLGSWHFIANPRKEIWP